MLRSLSCVALLALATTLSGCGSTADEIPATKEAAPTMTKEESMNKAMQGMPPEIKAKMDAMQAKQRR